MSETQNIEYKLVWRDDYLKWLCGFANANGGVLYIGKNDNGEIVGVKDTKKLLEELPNKIRTTMGMVADVSLETENQKDCIIVAIQPYPSPISYCCLRRQNSNFQYRVFTRRIDRRNNVTVKYFSSP